MSPFRSQSAIYNTLFLAYEHQDDKDQVDSNHDVRGAIEGDDDDNNPFQPEWCWLWDDDEDDGVIIVAIATRLSIAWLVAPDDTIQWHRYIVDLFIYLVEVPISGK